MLRTLVAALALSVGAVGFATSAHGAAGFGDVDAGNWYTEPIAWLVSESITTGTEPGCFSPQAPVTRGQIVTFLYRLDDARGNDPVSAPHPFEDVVASYQHVPVGWAFLNGITNGTSATSFAPDADVTRGDFAVLLWRYADEPAPTQSHPFTDITRGYQNTAISWMKQEGITTGTSPTTFTPDGNMTRAEAATFMFRFMGSPAVTQSQLSSSASCLVPLRTLLEINGMTATEAACAAGHLVDFELDFLLGVLEGSESMTGALIAAIAQIAQNGCITPGREAVVIALFL